MTDRIKIAATTLQIVHPDGHRTDLPATDVQLHIGRCPPSVVARPLQLGRAKAIRAR